MRRIAVKYLEGMNISFWRNSSFRGLILFGSESFLLEVMHLHCPLTAMGAVFKSLNGTGMQQIHDDEQAGILQFVLFATVDLRVLLMGLVSPEALRQAFFLLVQNSC